MKNTILKLLVLFFTAFLPLVGMAGQDGLHFKDKTYINQIAEVAKRSTTCQIYSRDAWVGTALTLTCDGQIVDDYSGIGNLYDSVAENAKMQMISGLAMGGLRFSGKIKNLILFTR